ncbi:MAG: phosphohistidine phosphatase SixA [Magnetovibrio sp.]|nr:phosphohistidine phosphatase SixA [Magnetovibrio sp.]
MHLYLVQHGLAKPKDEDPERPLSDQGRTDVGRMAAFLARTRPAIGRVIHSGKLRAAQTALIFAETIGPGRIVEQAAEGLAPKDSTDLVAAAIDGWTDDTMIVGHLPHLGRLVGRLVVGDEDETVVHFQPGTVVCVERGENGGGWTVTWAVRPELMGG